MRPLPHNYEIDLTGTTAGYAVASGAGLPDLTMAAPPEYGGPGDAWSPEHMLLASVSSCFLFTFRAVAKASHVDFFNVDAHTTGIVARSEGVTRFTDIVVRVMVTAPSGTDIDVLRRAVDKAAGHCLVSSSLATPVHIEAAIDTGREATSPMQKRIA